MRINASQETRWRSFAKVAIWRAGGVFWAFLVTWLFTGNVLLGLEVGLTYNAIRLVTHFVYERIWTRIRWGYVDTAKPDG